MSDDRAEAEAAWNRELHALAKRHHRRALLMVTSDVTGRTYISSPIDDPRDVLTLAEEVVKLVRRDADMIIAVSPHCTHGGKA